MKQKIYLIFLEEISPQTLGHCQNKPDFIALETLGDIVCFTRQKKKTQENNVIRPVLIFVLICSLPKTTIVL